MKALQIVGTVLLGGGLVNYVLPLYISIFGMVQSPNETNSFFLSLGGKIQRKWYFLNSLIYIAFIIAFSVIMFLLHNLVMMLILLPYCLALFILQWGNVYKRINDIFDSHKFALTSTIIYALFCLVSPLIYKYIPRCENVITVLVSLIWILLFLLPSKKEIVPDWYNESLKILKSIKHKYSDAVFDEYFYKMIQKKIKLAKNNVDYAEYFKNHTIEEWLYAEINNLSGDMIESGEYHIYRGLLSPLGKKIFWYFNKSLGELVKLQAKDENNQLIDEDYAINQHKTMLAIIKDLG